MISKISNVVLIPPSYRSAELIKKSEGVIVINSTAGFEALMYGKPVIILGTEFYMDVGITYDVKDLRELPKLYNAADLFVFPSFYEGFGLPPLEAMACGCPVITSNTSSLPEVVGDAGIMVDPHDVEGLADATHKILNNDGLKQDMIKRGLKRAKMFSWERCARETLDVYEDVYNGR